MNAEYGAVMAQDAMSPDIADRSGHVGFMNEYPLNGDFCVASRAVFRPLRNEGFREHGCRANHRKSVQPSQKKYSDFQNSQISLCTRPVPLRQRGARDRHGRGAGCGGRGCADDERR